MKYMDSEAAARYSNAPDYPERAAAAIEEMYAQCGDYEFDEEGLMRRGLIVRHLVLPGNIRNTQMVIEWFADFSKGRKVLFSLMSQYVPVIALEEYPELNRRISREEWRSACNYLDICSVTQGFIQDPDSADSAFIPGFDLSGTDV
jgi:putative pyruvate formate lyase activating enzyme